MAQERQKRAGANVQFQSDVSVTEDLDLFRKCCDAGTKLQQTVGAISVGFYADTINLELKICASFAWRGRPFAFVFRRLKEPSLLSVNQDYRKDKGNESFFARETGSLIEALKRPFVATFSQDIEEVGDLFLRLYGVSIKRGDIIELLPDRTSSWSIEKPMRAQVMEVFPCHLDVFVQELSVERRRVAVPKTKININWRPIPTNK